MCGSKKIGIGTLGDGIIAGLSSWKEVCRDCGYQGASLLFETEDEYNKYLKALKQHTTEEKTDNNEETMEEEPADLTKEDKEIVASVDETAELPQLSGKKNYVLEFIIAVILSIVFLVVLISGSYLDINDVIFTNDFFTIVLYFIGIFISVLIFFFLSIVFVETIYRSIRCNRKKK